MFKACRNLACSKLAKFKVNFIYWDNNKNWFDHRARIYYVQ